MLDSLGGPSIEEQRPSLDSGRGRHKTPEPPCNNAVKTQLALLASRMGWSQDARTVGSFWKLEKTGKWILPEGSRKPPNHACHLDFSPMQF